MNTYRRHRFPPNIISYTVWLYHRFNLSNRDVEDLLAERGMESCGGLIWLVSFLEYDLGYFDKERGRVKPGPSPFVPDKVLTMCPE